MDSDCVFHEGRERRDGVIRMLRGGLWYYGNIDEVALVTLSIMFYCFYVIIIKSGIFDIMTYKSARMCKIY